MDPNMMQCGGQNAESGTLGNSCLLTNDTQQIELSVQGGGDTHVYIRLLMTFKKWVVMAQMSTVDEWKNKMRCTQRNDMQS